MMQHQHQHQQHPPTAITSCNKMLADDANNQLKLYQPQHRQQQRQREASQSGDVSAVAISDTSCACSVSACACSRQLLAFEQQLSEVQQRLNQVERLFGESCGVKRMSSSSCSGGLDNSAMSQEAKRVQLALGCDAHGSSGGEGEGGGGGGGGEVEGEREEGGGSDNCGCVSQCIVRPDSESRHCQNEWVMSLDNTTDTCTADCRSNDEAQLKLADASLTTRNLTAAACVVRQPGNENLSHSCRSVNMPFTESSIGDNNSVRSNGSIVHDDDDEEEEEEGAGEGAAGMWNAQIYPLSQTDSRNVTDDAADTFEPLDNRCSPQRVPSNQGIFFSPDVAQESFHDDDEAVGSVRSNEFEQQQQQTIGCRDNQEVIGSVLGNWELWDNTADPGNQVGGVYSNHPTDGLVEHAAAVNASCHGNQRDSASFHSNRSQQQSGMNNCGNLELSHNDCHSHSNWNQHQGLHGNHNRANMAFTSSHSNQSQQTGHSSCNAGKASGIAHSNSNQQKNCHGNAVQSDGRVENSHGDAERTSSCHGNRHTKVSGVVDNASNRVNRNSRESVIDNLGSVGAANQHLPSSGCQQTVANEHKLVPAAVANGDGVKGAHLDCRLCSSVLRHAVWRTRQLRACGLAPGSQDVMVHNSTLSKRNTVFVSGLALRASKLHQTEADQAAFVRLALRRLGCEACVVIGRHFSGYICSHESSKLSIGIGERCILVFGPQQLTLDLSNAAMSLA